MVIPAHILRQALELYLQIAWPQTPSSPSPPVPPAAQALLARIQALPQQNPVPLDLLEKDTTISPGARVLRLGQPLYPFMKLAVDPVPEDQRCHEFDFLLRVDAHDRHLHAPPGSPDAAWLATVRQSNKEIGEKIESAWAAAGLPTFKEFLRAQLERRRARPTTSPPASS